MGGAVQPAKEALDAAVRVRQNARMALPLQSDSATRSSKLPIPAAAQDSAGGNMLVVAGASDPDWPRPSMLKIPGFMSAKTEASFAAAASLGTDRPHPSNRSCTRRRLVEPVDSRNPRVGRGMAKIYSGEMHAIRYCACILPLYCTHLHAHGLHARSAHSKRLKEMMTMLQPARSPAKNTSRARLWASVCLLMRMWRDDLSRRSEMASQVQFKLFRCERPAIAGGLPCMCQRTWSTACRKTQRIRQHWMSQLEQPETRPPRW